MSQVEAEARQAIERPLGSGTTGPELHEASEGISLRTWRKGNLVRCTAELARMKREQQLIVLTRTDGSSTLE